MIRFEVELDIPAMGISPLEFILTKVLKSEWALLGMKDKDKAYQFIGGPFRFMKIKNLRQD